MTVAQRITLASVKRFYESIQALMSNGLGHCNVIMQDMNTVVGNMVAGETTLGNHSDHLKIERYILIDFAENPYSRL